MVALFCYGTLLNPRIQVYLWGHCKTGSPASLAHHIVDYSGPYPRMVPVEPDEAYPEYQGCLGRVFQLTDEEFRAVTAYEGPEYRLVRVTLSDGGGDAYAFV